MQIKTIVVGPIQTNCYVLVDEKTREAVVIDPGDEPNIILPELLGLKVKYIVLTHRHWDHIGAVKEIEKITRAKIISPSDGEEIKFGQETLKIIATPGHAEESICLYTPGHLFSGDTLFSGTYGRIDLPGSSPRAMSQSLKLLSQLPDDTIVYPGHEETTTIKAEKELGTLG